jgi:hypothetical protein
MTNKFQAPNSKHFVLAIGVLVIGYYLGFGIWDLEF